jgi:hypothetical protein
MMLFQSPNVRILVMELRVFEMGKYPSHAGHPNAQRRGGNTLCDLGPLA